MISSAAFAFSCAFSRRPRAAHLGKLLLLQFPALSQRVNPLLSLAPKSHYIYPTMVARKRLELREPSREQRFRTPQIAASVMMKCRRDLNDSLQKRLLRLGRAQPKFLPGFVCLEELTRVEMRDAALESLVFTDRAHVILCKIWREHPRGSH